MQKLTVEKKKESGLCPLKKMFETEGEVSLKVLNKTYGQKKLPCYKKCTDKNFLSLITEGILESYGPRLLAVANIDFIAKLFIIAKMSKTEFFNFCKSCRDNFNNKQKLAIWNDAKEELADNTCSFCYECLQYISYFEVSKEEIDELYKNTFEENFTFTSV